MRSIIDLQKPAIRLFFSLVCEVGMFAPLLLWTSVFQAVAAVMSNKDSFNDLTWPLGCMGAAIVFIALERVAVERLLHHIPCQRVRLAYFDAYIRPAASFLEEGDAPSWAEEVLGELNEWSEKKPLRWRQLLALRLKVESCLWGRLLNTVPEEELYKFLRGIRRLPGETRWRVLFRLAKHMAA